jgi:hypothetical protein
MICAISGLGGRGGQSGAGGAGGSTFSCGPSDACAVNAQYCFQFSPGVPAIPPTYTCLAVPPACMPTPTCACLQSQGIAGSATCAESAPGALRVSVAAP